MLNLFSTHQCVHWCTGAHNSALLKFPQPATSSHPRVETRSQNVDMNFPPWLAQVSFQFQGCRVTDPSQPASDTPATYPAGLHPQHVRLHPSPEDVHSSFPPTVVPQTGHLQQKVHIRTACSSERDGMSVGITGTLLLSLCVKYREGCDGVTCQVL